MYLKMTICWILAIMLTFDLMNPPNSSSHILISGIHDIEQDPVHYFAPEDATRNLIPPQDQEIFEETFNRIYFLPWNQETPRENRGKFLEPSRKYKENPGYGEDKKGHTARWLQGLVSNAQLNDYPNTARKGITTSNSNLRELPTLEPIFNRFPSDGQGYAFDDLQYSAIPPNMPVYISHCSRDKAWFLVESHFGAGWISAEDVAFVDQSFITTWASGKYAAPTKDKTTLSDKNGHFLFLTSVGCLFPVASEKDNYFEILIAQKKENGEAQIGGAILSKRHAVLKPLPLTQENLARIISELLNKPYGWGGMHGDRDCSSTLKDLFTPFGVWLPRDSGDQAKVGRFISLKGLSLKEKEKAILKDEVPFLTLLWIPGHIMLFIGRHEEKVAVFHNMWSTAIKDSQEKERDVIIGKSVISDLYVGEEASRSRLSRIEGMTLLGR
jgi:cell wall-associated NlpC family hydrolase